MPRLEYIKNFFKHYKYDVESADVIYEEQVVPRLNWMITQTTKDLDSLFENDKYFKNQSDFCKAVRRCVLNFEEEVMTKEKETPWFGQSEWEGRVEEIVFLKTLCVECVIKQDDTRLMTFLTFMRENAKTAIIFGRQFNGLVGGMIELRDKVMKVSIDAVQNISKDNQVANLIEENKELSDLNNLLTLKNKRKDKELAIKDKLLIEVTAELSLSRADGKQAREDGKQAREDARQARADEKQARADADACKAELVSNKIICSEVSELVKSMRQEIGVLKQQPAGSSYTKPKQ